MSDNYADSLVNATVYYADWRNMTRDERYEAMCEGVFTGEANYKKVRTFAFRKDQDVKSYLWEEFNVGSRGGHEKLRSMSMGDIIVEDGEAFICAAVGWEPVDFDPDAVTKYHDDDAVA